MYNAAGQLIAEYTSDPVPPAQGGGGTSYLTSDHLGSTRVATNGDGSVKARYDYLPFGEEIGPEKGSRLTVTGYGASDSTRQKFTQKERDSESGLDYFLARYYSSAQGRYTSPDWSEDPEPIPYADLTNPQSLNLYAYVLNNPLSVADPDGHQDWWQKLKNGLSGSGFKTDAEIQAEKNAAITKLNQQAAKAAEELTNAGFDPDQISKLSNRQVIDLNNAIRNGQTEVESDGVKIELKLVPPGAGPPGPKMQRPATPGDMPPNKFGKDVMKWGGSSAQARQRISNLTREELERGGVTKRMAKEWRDFYRNEMQRNPANPSAAGRAELMQHAVKLLKGKK